MGPSLWKLLTSPEDDEEDDRTINFMLPIAEFRTAASPAAVVIPPSDFKLSAIAVSVNNNNLTLLPLRLIHQGDTVRGCA